MVLDRKLCAMVIQSIMLTVLGFEPGHRTTYDKAYELVRYIQ